MYGHEHDGRAGTSAPAGDHFVCGADDLSHVAELKDRLQAAEAEVAQLREALASQRLIGVAVGLLAHRFHCSPEQSWRLLVRLSQTSNVKVRELARILADAHAGRAAPADADVLAVLASQLPADRQSAQRAYCEPDDC